MAEIFVVEIFAFLLTHQEHKLLESFVAFLVEKRTQGDLFQLVSIMPKERRRLVQFKFGFSSIKLRVGILKVLIEDETDNDAIIPYRHSSKYQTLYLFMTYFHLVERQS
jgi:hypothetical protein